MTEQELKYLRVGAKVYNPATETRHTVTGIFNGKVQLDNKQMNISNETIELLVPDYIEEDLKSAAKGNGGIKRHGPIAQFKS